MITYDVYKITFEGKNPNRDLSGEEIYQLVSENGEWENVATYDDGFVAWHMWNSKWSDMAYTDEDDDKLNCAVYTMERTIRDDSCEPTEGYEVDYSVEAYMWR